MKTENDEQSKCPRCGAGPNHFGMLHPRNGVNCLRRQLAASEQARRVAERALRLVRNVGPGTAEWAMAEAKRELAAESALAEPSGEEAARVRAATICQRCRFHKPDWAHCGEHHCPEWPARESIREATASGEEGES